MDWETQQIYNRFFNEQKGRCKICGIHQSELSKKLALDHCHKTGGLRGLLCNKCNLGLGLFRDRVDLLLKAIIYLRQNRGLEADDVEYILDNE